MKDVSVKAAVSFDESLATAYEFDPEYLDGELLDRTLPGIPHARVQNRIGTGFEIAQSSWLFAAPPDRSRRYLAVPERGFRLDPPAIFE